jgi:hypothetical protein
MKVKCKTLSVTEKITFPSSAQVFEITPDTSEYLEVGKIYTVYGISIWMHGLNYLLDIPLAGTGKTYPKWLNVEYFDIVDSSLPNNMHFRYFGESDKRGVVALWGYKELIYEYDHYERLIEREESAIAIFAKRKQEIDQQVS